MGSIRVTGLAKSFGIDELFKNVSFEIKAGEKIGFVGPNGAGKSTLMKCLLGQAEYDSGSISIDSSDTIGYVEQQLQEENDLTLYEELRAAFGDIISLGAVKEAMEADIQEDSSEEKLAAYSKVVERFEHLGGYDFESNIRRAAFGLGFTEEDLKRPVKQFSGGQRTRIALARALLKEPDFLFLDEPTNHLDIKMIEWLEEFLRDYRGGVLLISHDRFFLDRVANRIFEIDDKQVVVYEGNYSYYAKVKQERYKARLSAYEKQQEYIKKTEEYIRKYKAGIKSKQARGRQSQLNRLERLVRPAAGAAFDHFAFNPPTECAQRVAEMEEVDFSFPDRKLFSKLNLLIRKGDGVALVGPNGAGKTTLLRLLIGELAPESGRIHLGSRVKVGYFSQQHEGLHLDRTLLEELEYEYGFDEEICRKYLGAFLFRGDDVYRFIGELSGGQRARLAFLKLMLTGANFLVLDEPTNHLDIPAKEAVEEALSTYPGTYITVSHDRYFLDKAANCILELSEEGLREYLGNYSYYRERKAQEEAEQRTEKKSVPGKEKEKPQKAVQEKPIVKKPNAGMSQGKREELLSRYEAEIAMAEAELKMLEHQMNMPQVQADPEESIKIAEAYNKKEQEITERYARWEALAEE